MQYGVGDEYEEEEMMEEEMHTMDLTLRSRS